MNSILRTRKCAGSLGSAPTPHRPAILNSGRLLGALLAIDRRDDLIADLEEEYDLITAGHGAPSAIRWYIWQVLQSVPPLVGNLMRRRIFAFLNGLIAGTGESLPLELAGRWAGRAFFLFAVGWIICVIWMMQPSQFGAASWLPEVNSPDGASYILDFKPEGPATRQVYKNSRYDLAYSAYVDPPCNCWRKHEGKFFIAAFGPPSLIIFLSLAWITISNRLQRRIQFN